MSKPSKTALHLTASPVYLAASAINNLIRTLPAGTAYFIGIVLITMFTGQLVQHQEFVSNVVEVDLAHPCSLLLLISCGLCCLIRQLAGQADVP